MAKFTYAMTDKAIVDGIADVGKRSKSIRADMHKLAVSILNNWAKSGAANVAAQRAGEFLANADPAFSQKIVNWFSAHAGFEYDSGDEVFTYTKTTLSTAEFQAAKGETMFDLTPDKKAQPAVNLRAMLLKDIKTAKKRRVEGVRDGVDEIDTELLTQVEALLEA